MLNPFSLLDKLAYLKLASSVLLFFCVLDMLLLCLLPNSIQFPQSNINKNLLSPFGDPFSKFPIPNTKSPSKSFAKISRFHHRWTSKGHSLSLIASSGKPASPDQIWLSSRQHQCALLGDQASCTFPRHTRRNATHGARLLGHGSMDRTGDLIGRA